MDVCLVSMPQAPVQTPSIALGLIQALLQRDGIEAKTFFANLWFLEFIGPFDYVQLDVARTADSVIDWLFASVAFRDYEPDHNQYLQRMMVRNSNLGSRNPEKVKTWLLDLRRRVPDFIDETARKILGYQPRILGCTSSFQQHVASLALMRRMREIAPSVITVLGGPNCETIMGRTTHEKFPWVDYVVSGEADSFISDLCRTLLKHGRSTAAVELPDGVFGPSHRENGYPHCDAKDGLPRAITASLAGLPMPNYDDYFEELRSSSFSNLILPAIPFETSRGCWWGQCTFCGLNGCGTSFRSKPAEQVLQELSTLVERYDTTRIAVVDNIVDMDYFGTLLPRVAASEKDFGLFFEIKSNLTCHQVEQLRSAGARWLNIGIESLHSKILRLIRKGASGWQNIQLLKWCRQNGITAGWNMLFGFPGEEDRWYEEMARWIPLLFHLEPCYFLYVRYCRYSTYFNNANEYGLRLKPSELYRFVFPLSKTELANQVYHFEDENTPDYYICLGNSHFPGRPGLEAVHVETMRWRKNWDPQKALLCMRDVNGVLQVNDLRPCATARTHRIEGLARDVLGLCDDAPTLAQLCSILEQDRGVTGSAVRSALTDLVDRKLVLEIDGRAISLVLKDPVSELPRDSSNPTGLFLMEAFLKLQ